MVFLGANIAGIVYVYVAFPNTGEIGALSKGAQLSMPFYDPADSKWVHVHDPVDGHLMASTNLS